MNLAEFLLARIGEDERFIQREDADPHPADRARVLAECAAKRAIVEQLDSTRPPASDADHLVEQELELALRYLAAVYADHPDFREEWRP